MPAFPMKSRVCPDNNRDSPPLRQLVHCRSANSCSERSKANLDIEGLFGSLDKLEYSHAAKRYREVWGSMDCANSRYASSLFTFISLSSEATFCAYSSLLASSAKEARGTWIIVSPAPFGVSFGRMCVLKKIPARA